MDGQTPYLFIDPAPYIMWAVPKTELLNYKCYYNRTITRFSIQTAGLAFGGTRLCSYRVRRVGGSCAEHLTVESYTITISLQSHLLLLVFHHPLTLSL